MMQKTVIAPIIAVLALLAQLIFGVTIPEDVVEQVVIYVGNGVALGTVLYGIFKNHKKESEQKEPTSL